MEDWENVVFSDESAFRLINSNGRTMVRRLEDEAWEEGTFQPTSGQGRSVIVWGAISTAGAGPLVRFQDTVTAEEYLSAFRHRLRRYYPRLYGGDMLFVHDNAPAHRAELTTKWFQDKDIETFDWPSRSPDLNIIENVWGRIKFELRTQVFDDLDDLWHEVERLWKTLITREFISSLYESMPRRIASVIENQGNHTKY